MASNDINTNGKLKLHIDSNLIKSNTSILPDELKDLGVCAFDENDFEKFFITDEIKNKKIFITLSFLGIFSHIGGYLSLFRLPKLHIGQLAKSGQLIS